MKPTTWRIRTALLILVVMCTTVQSCQNSCRDSAPILANAYLRMNPIYEVYYGSFESYIKENALLFMEGSPVLQCAKDLSEALISKSIETYDPEDYTRRQELDTELKMKGISTGQHAPTQSELLMAMGLALQRLVRVLPEAAKGNFEPYYTPTNDVEHMEAMAREMFKGMLTTGMMTEVLRQAEPQIKELAQLDYKFFISIANNM